MRRFADEAKARAPHLADPEYLLAGVALWFEWNVRACERHLQSALTVEPNHAGALMLAAVLAAMQRQPEQAWMAVDRALRVDPLGEETRTWLLAVAWSTGEFERQIEEATRLIAEHPGYGDAFRWRSMAYTVRGEYDRARTDLETFGALTNTHLYTLNGLGLVAALEGKTAEARRILDVMMDRSKREWVPLTAFGQVEQQLGNYETALDWYERAYPTRDFLLSVLHVDPQFRIVPPGRTRPITEHPRWVELLQRIGVAPEYQTMDTSEIDRVPANAAKPGSSLDAGPATPSP
jgi:tetratricopeptide (TPR) repeat protein